MPESLHGQEAISIGRSMGIPVSRTFECTEYLVFGSQAPGNHISALHVESASAVNHTTVMWDIALHRHDFLDEVFQPTFLLAFRIRVQDN